MAKSSRSTTRKANNRRLKSKVFGPVEDARAERLSAKLLELAAQPKPESKDEEDIQIVDDAATNSGKAVEETLKGEADMDVDATADNITTKKPQSKQRIQKRKPSKIVFSKWGEKRSSKRRKH